MGLLEKSKKLNVEETPEEEYAHDVLVKLEDTMSHISPFRVVIVSVVALMIIASTIVAMTWIVPYDKVTVDVVYIQSSAGHVILTEIDNDGSRSVSDLTLVIRFLDSNNIEIDRTSFNKFYQSQYYLNQGILRLIELLSISRLFQPIVRFLEIV